MSPREMPHVVVVTSRCRHSRQTFGVRVEEVKSQDWHATWAFAIKDDAAKREGYSKAILRGRFAIDHQYPGCPGCTGKGLVKCQCGQLSCFDGETREFTCPWCNRGGKLGGAVDNLSARGDR